MNHPRLYMLLLGCTPPGRHTEQHDAFFTIAPSLKDCIPAILAFWPEAKGKLHIDAWREVTLVDGYRVTVEEKAPAADSSGAAAGPGKPSGEPRLYFINLGGYKPGEFEEYHYKMVAAGKDKGEAIKKSKTTAFYQHTGFSGAESHVDNKYGIDVDDAHELADILPAEITNRYIIHLTPANEKTQADEIHLGYFQLKNL